MVSELFNVYLFFSGDPFPPGNEAQVERQPAFMLHTFIDPRIHRPKSVSNSRIDRTVLEISDYTCFTPHLENEATFLRRKRKTCIIPAIQIQDPLKSTLLQETLAQIVQKVMRKLGIGR